MNASLYINFGTAAVTFIFGLLMLLGIIFPGKLDTTMLMFSIVLMVYGVYRFITTISKLKQAKLLERSQKLKEETERLLDKS